MGTLSTNWAPTFAQRTASQSLDTINAGGAPDDWALWTTGSVTPTDTRSGGGATITMAFAGANTFSSATESGAQAFAVTWTNGTPTASGSSLTDVFNSSFATGNGVTISFPADTNVRTAWIFCGPFNTSLANIAASLSDSSAAALSFTNAFGGANLSPTATTTFNACLLTFQYSANSPSQTLTVTLTAGTTTPQTVTVQAAAVAKTSGAAPASLASNLGHVSPGISGF